MFKLLVAAVSLTAATCVVAQVEIVQSSPQTASVNTVPSVNQQAELFYQLQAMQQEVLDLRGLVEVQAYEIKRLKQQRLDDYVDLDRRIVSLGGGAGKAKEKTADPEAAAANNEKQDYDQALALLRKRDIDGSIKAFNLYLEAYPDGKYAANVHYWLGETYLLQGDLESARQAFTLLVESYPDNRKAVDARYKLGTVYYQLDDKPKAKSLLEEVASGTSSSAQLARKYLQAHYSQ